MKKWLCIIFLLVTTALSASDDTTLTKYTEGEQAKSKADREQLFNTALSAYLKIDTPSYQLSYNIANCYFQLGEYGLSILYYYRCLAQNPRFDKAAANLKIAQAKIGLQKEASFSQYTLAPSEKQLFYIGFLLIAFILFSLYLWLSHRFACTVSGLLLADMIWDQYLKPLEAVIIKPSPLRKDAGTQYDAVTTKEPIYGQSVQVLQFRKDIPWIKIKTTYGEEGYVSKEQARII